MNSRKKFGPIRDESPLFSWTTVQERFGGLWVELCDIEWPGDVTKPARTSLPSWYPKRARVRNVAASRSLLMTAIKDSGHDYSDSIIIFVHSIPHLSHVHLQQGDSVAL